jgi:hypothetical protein
MTLDDSRSVVETWCRTTPLESNGIRGPTEECSDHGHEKLESRDLETHEEEQRNETRTPASDVD